MQKIVNKIEKIPCQRLQIQIPKKLFKQLAEGSVELLPIVEIEIFGRSGRNE
jgi:hypothetical protein